MGRSPEGGEEHYRMMMKDAYVEQPRSDTTITSGGSPIPEAREADVALPAIGRLGPPTSLR